MSRKHALLIALTFVFLVPTRASADVEVADVFGSEMVLQRDVPVPVWGKAEPGEKVIVSFAGQSKTATADGVGRWSVTLDAMAASDRPRPLVVQGTGEPIMLENVLVGEVWLVLYHWLGKQYGTEGPVPSASTRVCEFGASRDNFSPTPQEAFGKNNAWGPNRYNGFDVLSIPFANRLSEELGVPVGIVRARVGDLDATIPVEGFAAMPALDDIARQVETWYPTTRRGKQAYQQWYAQLKQWKQTLDQKLERGESIKPGQPPLAPGPVLGDPAQPTVVFNGQLNPLVPLAFRGVLHIHEESTQGDPRCTNDLRYADKMRALIAGLRAVFRRPDLAFAFSQRNQPDIYHAHTAGGKENKENVSELNFNAWHAHRDRQRRVLPFENTGMVVTLDVENYSGKVGERFAGWALAAVYGRGGASSGPVYKGHRIEGDCVVLEFDHADGGLTAADYPEIGRPLVEQKDGVLRFFAVAGENRIFHRAEALIEGKTVIVRSDKVAQPVAVRYACHFDPRGMNLYNRAGLPASPFSTDDWPMEPFDEAVEAYASKGPEELVALLGYPTMPHSHAAAKALGAKGETTVLPIVERLLGSRDPDERCGGLRTLGYLYWMGLIPRASGYYSQQPQEATPAIARAIEMIGEAAADADPHVRRCAAEALALIGSENETVFEIIRKLATDDDALVRTAALRMSKYRFKTHAHNTALAYALLENKPLADRTSAALAGTLLNHYRIAGPIDLAAAARYLQKIGPGQGGDVVGDLGDMLRRIQLPGSTKKALDDPEVMSAVLHLHAIGYRNYFLYGVWRWVTLEDHVPAIQEEIRRLRVEIERLGREKPEGWRDLSSRYADAIEGLEAEIVRAEIDRAESTTKR